MQEKEEMWGQSSFFVFWRINSQVRDSQRKLFLLLRLGFLPSLMAELELMLPLLSGRDVCWPTAGQRPEGLVLSRQVCFHSSRTGHRVGCKGL